MRRGCVRLITHKIFQPSPKDPLDFESTIEKTLLDLKQRFRIREVRFDPWSMQATAQRLVRAGINMVEWPQSVPNISDASTCLYDLIKAGNLRVYPDAALTLAIQRAVAVEVPRGWKISKASQSHKVDIVIALAMASLAAVEGGGQTLSGFQGIKDLDIAKRAVGGGTPIAEAAATAGVGAQELTKWIERDASAPARVSAMLSRPPRDQIDYWEYACKLIDAGRAVEEACAETRDTFNVDVPVEGLRAYHTRANAPLGPSRPRFAPPGATNPFT